MVLSDKAWIDLVNQDVRNDEGGFDEILRQDLGRWLSSLALIKMDLEMQAAAYRELPEPDRDCQERHQKRLRFLRGVTTRHYYVNDLLQRQKVGGMELLRRANEILAELVDDEGNPDPEAQEWARDYDELLHG